VKPAWTAEWVVSRDLARSLIETQLPQFAPARVELVGAGWDNTAFRVNDGYIFRFPRRQIAVPLLDAETRLLPWMAPRLPLPIPVPTFTGCPTPEFPCPFAGYRLLPGRTACGAALTANQRIAAAEPLARFLAALHALPAAEAVRHGAGLDTLARLDLARRLPRARDSLNQLAQRGLIADLRPFRAILEDAPTAYTPRADTLVHGDLYARHLLVNEDRELAGVIDWGDVHLGDPAVDLAIAHSFLPPGAHAFFRRAYGRMEDVSWRLARLRALWHTALVLIYGHDTGDIDLVREGLQALQFIRAEAEA
jgi:aminoglycoside phosphotransferase (APT) family kinase protein